MEGGRPLALRHQHTPTRPTHPIALTGQNLTPPPQLRTFEHAAYTAILVADRPANRADAFLRAAARKPPLKSARFQPAPHLLRLEGTRPCATPSNTRKDRALLTTPYRSSGPQAVMQPNGALSNCRPADCLSSTDEANQSRITPLGSFHQTIRKGFRPSLVGK